MGLESLDRGSFFRILKQRILKAAENQCLNVEIITKEINEAENLGHLSPNEGAYLLNLLEESCVDQQE